MDKLLAALTLFAVFILAAVGISALMGLIFMWIWNGVIVSIAPETLPTFTFLQAWGIWFLIGTMTSAFRGSSSNKD